MSYTPVCEKCGAPITVNDDLIEALKACATEMDKMRLPSTAQMAYVNAKVVLSKATGEGK